MTNEKIVNVIKKIKKECSDTILAMTKDCGTNMYASGRVVESFRILTILDDVEDEEKTLEGNEILKIEIEELKEELSQQKALTETYKACYRAKHNDVKDEFIKLKQIIDEIKEYCELDNIYYDDLPFRTQMDDILDIIKKTKEK